MNDITNLGDLFDGQGAGDLGDPGNSGTKRFYGKYRGTVVTNIDPEMRGRLLVRVPDVLGPFPSSWALPCVPLGGPQMGMFSVPIALPAISTQVWVEFEHGNPDFPIWVGFFWGSAADVPTQVKKFLPPGTPGLVIQTPLTQKALVLTDTSIILTNGTGTSMMMITDAAITITAPAINITSPTVTINNGALIIT